MAENTITLILENIWQPCFMWFLRVDSLREIQTSITAKSKVLNHIEISKIPLRSTLSAANKRRFEKVFEAIYLMLYEQNKHLFTFIRQPK